MKIYLDKDLGKMVDEREVRNTYFDLELNDIYSNIDDYKEGLLDLEFQLSLLKLSQYGDIKQIIANLYTSWNIEIEEIGETK